MNEESEAQISNHAKSFEKHAITSNNHAISNENHAIISNNHANSKKYQKRELFYNQNDRIISMGIIKNGKND